MIDDSVILEQLSSCIVSTNFSSLGTRYEGKVRDSYSLKDSRRILVTTDRLSAFDKVVTTIPFKGQVLTELAMYWFNETSHIVQNHVISHPDPNVIIGREAKVLPIEVVVRGYLTGSAWRDYQEGRPVSGIQLKKGLRHADKFIEPLLTPSTKARKGEHDIPISEADILEQGIVPKETWEAVRSAALRLFNLGQKRAVERGLLLVDTKYEFGVSNGELLLVDEIHTLDSSRYWIAQGYEERLEKGDEQQMLDKEPTRQWLLSQGFKGDGPIPEFTAEHRVAIAKRYIDAFERITGQPFVPVKGDALSRIETALSKLINA